MGTTERQVANAVGLIIAGAMRDVDNGEGTASAIYFAVARELSDWLEGEPELYDTIFNGGLGTTKRVALSYLTPVAIDDMLQSDTMPDDVRTLLEEYRTTLG